MTSVDRRSGRTIEVVAEHTSDDEVDALCARAAAHTRRLAELGRGGRAAMLRAMADALDADRSALVSVADRETALGTARLDNELNRTCFQLRFFAEVIEDAGYLEATIDHPVLTGMGPRPDLRRMLTPLGPVAVFAASNFPLAFSVPGGDTASALAAGCPVVVKAHSAHPATSLAALHALRAGAAEADAPTDVVALVFGQRAGIAAVRHPAIEAVGFTGSVAAGRALHDIAAARARPIPFYGELGALNAFVVAPGAAAERAEAIAGGLASSFTLGAGQFCTKPGLAFIPAGSDGQRLRAALAREVRALSSQVLLDDRVAAGYTSGTAALTSHRGVDVLATGRDHAHPGQPLLLSAPITSLSGPLLQECFGPVLVLIEYDGTDTLLAALAQLEPALTATVHAADADRALAARLIEHFSRTVGRLVWNGYPTGVAVSWAMQHGGPYPATTNALHTSVGAAAIRRWLRPVSYQDVPDELLPPELREANPDRIPRRVDGVPIHLPTLPEVR